MKTTLCFPTALLTLLLAMTSATTAQATRTVTATPASTAPSAQYTDAKTLETSAISAHNFYRSEHNATALTWNATSAATAKSWASACEFEHSGGPTGENLAAGYPNVTASIDGWGSERKTYDFGKAEFSKETGHFTQLVWSGTTSVGCGVEQCDGEGGTPGWYLVCEYWPVGNVIGAFKENVQSQSMGSADDTAVAGVVGDAGEVRVWWLLMVGMMCATTCMVA